MRWISWWKRVKYNFGDKTNGRKEENKMKLCTESEWINPITNNSVSLLLFLITRLYEMNIYREMRFIDMSSDDGNYSGDGKLWFVFFSNATIQGKPLCHSGWWLFVSSTKLNLKKQFENEVLRPMPESPWWASPLKIKGLPNLTRATVFFTENLFIYY